MNGSPVTIVPDCNHAGWWWWFGMRFTINKLPGNLKIWSPVKKESFLGSLAGAMGTIHRGRVGSTWGSPTDTTTENRSLLKSEIVPSWTGADQAVPNKELLKKKKSDELFSGDKQPHLQKEMEEQHLDGETVPWSSPSRNWNNLPLANIEIPLSLSPSFFFCGF